MSSDVIVIGAGYGGLTAAAILAHNGVEVEVLEATGHLGGRASYYRKGGFLVDYGMHGNRYGQKGAAAKALKRIGYKIDFIPMGEPLVYRDSSFMPFPTGVYPFMKSEYLSGMDKAAIISDMVRLSFARTFKKADIPLEEVTHNTDRAEVGSLFKLLSGLGLISPDISVTSTVAFVTFLRKAMRTRETISYPRHGTSQLIEALSQAIKQSGKITTGSRVKSLNITSGKVTGVRLKEEELHSKAVIFAVPLQAFPGMVGDGLPDEFLERCSSIIPTAGISLDLCLSDKVSDIDGPVINPDPVFFGQFTSNMDPDTAPEGKQLTAWFRPLPVDMMNDQRFVKSEQEKLKDVIGGMFPGIIDKIEWERVLKLKMVDGFEPRVGQTAKCRPGTRVLGVENLFLAGDVVSAPGSGGDVAFASGSLAAHEVLSFLS
ncbi:MAG: NAD(P)/FAD-dependent oxidoreductase [Actinobacteria bacterium]|nr:NAD(P)/FAD-dependent oxidoreductase [Actinomycetota bacterium]MCG2819778.1 NAD(P)/FAD-dependent oxidoreductase [Actinomycetes bacterium]MBU4219282.1 NAD(P)/FAD-dependent oxidoreductase [Actinomycetota bacterium]MBU4359566.1 NAD(P)/FAD-dependent oxidoreductase [Actinomycetota bacterium]MBU4390856.1 NAD(P)/FAD-dependent oxidoreductase [Actinomycetota bacterium]